METSRSLQDSAGVPILDKVGRFQKDPAATPTVFVMKKSQGFGVDFKAAMGVPGVEMAAICDIYEPNLNRALKTVPKAQGYKEYRAVMDRHGVERVRMTATSAARDAANRDDFFTAAGELAMWTYSLATSLKSEMRSTSCW